MKYLSLLMLAGGLLAAVAFFLPYSLTTPGSGFFGAGTPLKDIVNSSLTSLGVIEIDRGRALQGEIVALLEPAGRTAAR